MEKVVPIDTARKEVLSWVEFKKISEKRKSELEGVIEMLAENVSAGELSIDPGTFEITQKLKFPLGENNATNQLVFKPRIQGYALQDAMSGVKFNDEIGKTFARISASTGVSVNIIKKMDSEDLAVSSNIAVFFTL